MKKTVIITIFALVGALPAVTLGQTGGPRLPPGLDGKFLSLTSQLSGFGGYFFDANGDLNVYLTQAGSEAAAGAALPTSHEIGRNDRSNLGAARRRSESVAVILILRN